MENTEQIYFDCTTSTYIFCHDNKRPLETLALWSYKNSDSVPILLRGRNYFH